ncbi:SLC13 family permease [soil metagenome]
MLEAIRPSFESEPRLTTLAVAVFIIVYLGMALGRFPGFAIDRTGIALLGLIVLLASGDLTLDAAGRAVDMPTIALLFALMIVSSQFEQSGFYGWVADRITRAARHPRRLLAVLIAATGLLSAVLTNDVVVFALTPLICAGLLRRGLDVRPYLIALAGAANAGSAATLIGNPQNILIGQAGHIDFARYIALALPPTLVALAAVYLAVVVTWSGPLTPRDIPQLRAEPIIVGRFQTTKGFLAIAVLIGLFLSPFPHELGALAVAGVLLLSRRLSSRDMIGAVDWHLLLLFVCLFGVTAAFARTGIAQDGLAALAAHGLAAGRVTVMTALSLFTSNTIGNVPTVVLVLGLMPDLPQGALIGLALLSTFAGNLLLTGSLCNIIVAERAQASGATLTFGDFARSGIPMTLVSLTATAGWLWIMGLMPL